MTDHNKESHELAPIPNQDISSRVRRPILHFPYEQWLDESRDELTRTLERQLASMGYSNSLVPAFATNSVELRRDFYRDPNDNTWHSLKPGFSAADLEMTDPEILVLEGAMQNFKPSSQDLETVRDGITRRYLYVRRSLMRSSPTGRVMDSAARFINQNQNLIPLIVRAVFARETEGAGMAMHANAGVRDPLFDVPEQDYYQDRRHGLAVAKAFIDLLSDPPTDEPMEPTSSQRGIEKVRQRISRFLRGNKPTGK